MAELMNFGEHTEQDFEARAAHRSVKPGVIAFLICIVLGSAIVAWSTWSNVSMQRARAQVEAISHAAALELEFRPAIRGAEVLAAHARQGGGTISNFAQLAGALYAAMPELASLELQPGGVVSDIFPRVGNQRAIGFNVFKDPDYRTSANAALQSGTCTVAGPLLLYRGEPGLVVRVPVFLKTRAGENRFWGFVAASIGLQESLRHARLEELPNLGYDYALFLPRSGSGKAIALSRSGLDRPENSVVQPLRLQNFELRLALSPHRGWIHETKLVVESLAVVVISVLVAWVLAASESRRRNEEALAQARRLLAAETAQKRKAEEAATNARATVELETKKAAADLEAARAEIASQKQVLREVVESRESLESAFHKARADADELQARLERSLKSHEEELSAKQGELAEGQAKLTAAATKNDELEAALDRALESAELAASKLQAHEKKAQAALADLQARLDGERTTLSKRMAADSAKLKEAEASIQELKARLATAAGVQDRVMELEAQLSASKENPKPPVGPIATISPAVGSSSIGQDHASSASESAATESVPAKRKRVRRRDQNQIELFGGEPSEAPPEEAPASEELKAEPAESAAPSREEMAEEETPADPDLESEREAEEPGSTVDRKPAARRAVDVAQLRRAVHEILPLLTERDPGARDCAKANRSVFRSAFPPAAFDEFEGFIKNGTFDSALDQITRLARKHGIHV